MRERVREMGGLLDITSDGNGTRVQVLVPEDPALDSRQPSGPTASEESGTTEKIPMTPTGGDVDAILFSHA
jgi:hypothetical protein